MDFIHSIFFLDFDTYPPPPRKNYPSHLFRSFLPHVFLSYLVFSCQIAEGKTFVSMFI
jgi:hypothetical protein